MARTATTANPEELAKFEAMADSWWDPQGAFRPLHRFNPVRIAYVRDRAAAHFGRDPLAPHTFAGLSLIDIGCGGGLISEPMARLGFTVTGLDAAEKNIGIARAHAARDGLPITYRAELAEDLAAAGEQYDVVLCLEVVEHVDDVPLFLASAAAMVKPGGLLIGATLNRTLKSLALAKFGAEYVLRWLPRGTHDWRRFLKPHEFVEPLQAAGLSVAPLTGVSYHPVMDEWALSADLSVNYLLTATKAG